MSFEITKAKNLKAYVNETGVTDVIVPQEVRSIGKAAFSHNHEITSVTLHENINKITVWGFYDCTALKAIYVDLENQFFADVDGVLYNKDKTKLLLCPGGKTECIIPDGVVSIENYAFSGCKFLRNVHIPDSVISIGVHAFNACSELREVNISNGVKTIGERAFSYCSILKEIIIPDNVTEVGKDAFMYCNLLKKISFSHNQSEVGQGICSCCDMLEEVIIQNGISLINDSAFYHCTSIKTLVIPESVKEIGRAAFAGCTVLKNLTLKEGLQKIGDFAFSDCNALMDVVIPKSVKKLGEDAFPEKFMPKKKKSVENQKNPKFGIEDNYLVRYNEPDSDVLDDKCYGEPFEEYLQNCNGSDFPNWSKIRIPKEVTVIGDGCFSECHSVAVVTIPDGVTRIEDGAFYECLNLDRITIPESVEEIGSKIFELCFNLRCISFVKNGKKVKFPFDYSDYGKSLSSLDKNGEKQMNLLTHFITAKTKEECNDIISQITSDRVNEELIKIVKKSFGK